MISSESTHGIKACPDNNTVWLNLEEQGMKVIKRKQTYRIMVCAEGPSCYSPVEVPLTLVPHEVMLRKDFPDVDLHNHTLSLLECRPVILTQCNVCFTREALEAAP